MNLTRYLLSLLVHAEYFEVRVVDFLELYFVGGQQRGEFYFSDVSEEVDREFGLPFLEVYGFDLDVLKVCDLAHVVELGEPRVRSWSSARCRDSRSGSLRRDCRSRRESRRPACTRSGFLGQPLTTVREVRVVLAHRDRYVRVSQDALF
jgi:hypothetical protein